MLQVCSFPKWIILFLGVINIIILSYFNKTIAQLNISQNPESLNFFPVCAGKYVFWEFTDIQNIGATGPKRSLKVFNGIETSTFIEGFSPSREITGDGEFAVVKSGTSLILYDGKVKKVITDKYPNAEMPVIKGKEIAFLSPNDKNIILYSQDSLKNLQIIGLDSNRKTLLGILENQLFVKTEGGDLYIVDYNSDQPVATKLNKTPNPSTPIFSANTMLWLEYDGNDQEIYQWKLNEVIALTNNDKDDLLPAASQYNFAYLQKDALDGSTIILGNGTPVLKTSAEITDLFFVKETLVWNQKNESDNLEIYTLNNGTIEKLSQENTEVSTFLRTENFAVWKSASADEEVIKCFNGNHTFDIFSNSEINFQPLGELFLNDENLAWDTGYDPSIIYLYNLAGNNFSTFKLGDLYIDICKSSNTFFLPIIATDSLPEGLTGLDIVLEYDSAIMTATEVGIVSLKDNPLLNFYVNTREAGKCNIGIFLDGGDGNFISGKDTIISLQFILNKKAFDSTVITAKEIVLSYETRSGKINPALPSTIKSVNSQSGKILVRDNERVILTDDLEGFNEPTQTNIIHFQKGNAGEDDRISDVHLDSLGNFKVPVKYAKSTLSIIRDIPGDYYNNDNCSDVMSIINSMDRNKALAIATSEFENPTVFDLIAADVNLDGRVTSGDATMISSRVVNVMCEYPQLGNYRVEDMKYIPSDLYIPSRDWVFISEDSPILNKKYDKDHVPSIPFNVDFSLTDSVKCSQRFYSVMLGDVAQSLGNSTPSVQDISSKVIFDIEKLLQKNPEEIIIPVYASSSEKFYGMDFSFDFKDLSVLDVMADNLVVEHFHISWNISNKNKLMVSVSNVNGGDPADILLHIKVKPEKGFVDEDNFSNIKSFYNGVPAEVEITDLITSNILEVADPLVVSPNPSTGKVFIKIAGKDNSGMEILNNLGNVIQKIQIDNSKKEYEIELNQYSSGIYYIKLYNQSGFITRRILKY